jgi:hypothetical protein
MSFKIPKTLILAFIFSLVGCLTNSADSSKSEDNNNPKAEAFSIDKGDIVQLQNGAQVVVISSIDQADGTSTIIYQNPEGKIHTVLVNNQTYIQVLQDSVPKTPKDSNVMVPVAGDAIMTKESLVVQIEYATDNKDGTSKVFYKDDNDNLVAIVVDNITFVEIPPNSSAGEVIYPEVSTTTSMDIHSSTSTYHSGANYSSSYTYYTPKVEDQALTFDKRVVTINKIYFTTQTYTQVGFVNHDGVQATMNIDTYSHIEIGDSSKDYFLSSQNTISSVHYISSSSIGNNIVVFDDFSKTHSSNGGFSEGDVTGLWYAYDDQSFGGSSEVLDANGDLLSQTEPGDPTKWLGWNFSEGNAYQNGALEAHLKITEYAIDEPNLAWDAWAAAGLAYKFKLREERGEIARRADESTIGEAGQLSFEDAFCIDMEYTGSFGRNISYLRIDFDETRRYNNHEDIMDNNNPPLYSAARYTVPNGDVYGGRATIKIPIVAVSRDRWDSSPQAPDSWDASHAADIFQILIHRISAPAEEDGFMTDPGTEVLKIYKVSKNDC